MDMKEFKEKLGIDKDVNEVNIVYDMMMEPIVQITMEEETVEET